MYFDIEEGVVYLGVSDTASLKGQIAQHFEIYLVFMFSDFSTALRAES